VTRKKAEAYLSELEDHDVLITGDTVVFSTMKCSVNPNQQKKLENDA